MRRLTHTLVVGLSGLLILWSVSVSNHLATNYKQGLGSIRTSPTVELEASKGKEPLVQQLLDAGVELDSGMIQSLPQWKEVVALYGEEAVLYGSEDQCERFQSVVNGSNAFIAPAGFFNSGTNALYYYLRSNCVLPHFGTDESQFQDHVIWQPPWGKHLEASKRLDQTMPHMKLYNKNHILPIVLVRDPYQWMKSMCRSKYSLSWPHKEEHCPNLVPNHVDIAHWPALQGMPSIPVTAELGTPNNRFTKNWTSLVHVWNEWNRDYLEADDFPRIMVRFEDLIFRPKQMIQAICKCAGGTAADDNNFTYYSESIKAAIHKFNVHTNMVSAMIKYGTQETRRVGYTTDDLEHVMHEVDDELMKTFGYHVIDYRMDDEQQ